MILRSQEDVAYGITGTMLRGVIEEHQREVARLTMLRDYSENRNHGVLNHKREPGLPNNQLAHPHARYISLVASSYLAGKPIAYTCDNEKALEPLLAAFERLSISSIDIENARKASIYGRGVEVLHVDEDAMPCINSVDPISAFVVYSDAIDPAPLFGVYYMPTYSADGTQNGFRAYVADSHTMTEYRASDIASLADSEPVHAREHFFGGVPIVEYWNNDEETGDFEYVLPLIDAYDRLQSDRVNDKEQFVDSLLVLYGCTLDVDERGRSPGRQLREDKALVLPDATAKAEYLSKQLNEADAEVLRQALKEDIYRLSMVPDMSDANFASNASGVAMRYKLKGLEDLTNIKERWFTEGLRTRLKLLAHFFAVKGYPALDAGAVKITLTRALPQNELEIAQILQMLESGKNASIETRLKHLHPDWNDEAIQAEIDRIRSEGASGGKEKAEEEQTFEQGENPDKEQ